MAKAENPRAVPGNNAGPAGFAADQLKSFIERVERLQEERDTISEDIRDVMAEAKGDGFDTKVIRHILRLRKQDKAERQEFEALVDTYMQALGMLFTPDD